MPNPLMWTSPTGNLWTTLYICIWKQWSSIYNSHKKSINLMFSSCFSFICVHYCLELRNKRIVHIRPSSMPHRTDRHLMLPHGLLLHFEPDWLLLFQNKALWGGKRKHSDRVPCGWSLRVIGGGPAGVEEGFLLKANWNNLAFCTWKALKFLLHVNAVSRIAVVQWCIYY